VTREKKGQNVALDPFFIDLPCRHFTGWSLNSLSYQSSQTGSAVQ